VGLEAIELIYTKAYAY